MNKSSNRILLALAVAIVAHAIFAALFPAAAPRPTPQAEVVAQVTVSRRTPAPSPSPAQTPSPSHARALGPAQPLVVRLPTAATLGRTGARSGAARPKPPVLAHAKPVWDIPSGAQGAGAGNDGGSGSGAGNGNGGGGATQPCGYVEFSDPNGTRYDDRVRGYWVDVAMTVHFPDRHSESLLLDYPWFYADAASNPWSQQNLGDPKVPTRFQGPPPAKRAAEPALVQYVIAHSNREGLTLLRDCP